MSEFIDVRKDTYLNVKMNLKLLPLTLRFKLTLEPFNASDFPSWAETDFYGNNGSLMFDEAYEYIKCITSKSYEQYSEMAEEIQNICTGNSECGETNVEIDVARLQLLMTKYIKL